MYGLAYIWIRGYSLKPCVNFIKINTIYSAISQFMPHVRTPPTPFTICINLASQLEEGHGMRRRRGNVICVNSK